MRYTLKTIIILPVIMIGCYSPSSNDNKENELLKKEIKLLKKEKELFQQNSSDKNIDESSVYNKKEALEIKQSVGDRIIEIKAFYSKIQRTPNKEDNCISATETRNDELRNYPFENTAKECQLADDFMYQQVNLSGREWGETATFYYKEDQCFFVYLIGDAEACGYDYRVYYDGKGEVIRVLLAENDCDGDYVGSSVEVTDEKRKQEILSSIANSKKELRTILKTLKN
jgi:hypothetical protein